MARMYKPEAVAGSCQEFDILSNSVILHIQMPQ